MHPHAHLLLFALPLFTLCLGTSRGLAAEPLRIPAFTAYIEPDPNGLKVFRYPGEQPDRAADHLFDLG